MRPIFMLSKETAALINLFREMHVDEVMSFEEASRRLGFNIVSSLAAYQYAKRVALREDILVEGVWGHGFKRLVGHDGVHVPDKHMKSIHRKARHGTRILEVSVRISNLSRDEMLKVTAQLARLGVISGMSTPYKTNAQQTPFQAISTRGAPKSSK